MKWCELNGLKFYYLENDRYVGQRVALDKYEPYETKVMLEQVKKGDVVVDVGANIGYYTLLMAQKVGKNGKVYAFEPEKTNFEILKKNVEANKLNNVVLINAGAGEKESMEELVISKENFGDHKVKIQKSNAQCPNEKLEKIRIIKLDEVIKEKVDLMKIDTQGYEPMVVKGAKTLIEKYNPEIFMEYTPGDKTREMMEYLAKIYKNTWIIDDYLFAYYKGRLPIDRYCNNKKGYTDVWLSNRNNLSVVLGQLKNMRIKKLVRNILGLKQTG